MENSLRVADALLDELAARPALREHAPTMTQVKKISYTHDAMIDLIVERPTISQNEIAATFGYSVTWVSHIFASDAFQMRLAQRKEELVDPTLRLTIEERFKALVQRSLDILQEKLARPAHSIPDNLALQAAALGARSLGLGRPDASTPPAPPGDRLQHLATRLVVLQRNVRERVQNGQVIEGEVSETVYDSGGAARVQGPGSQGDQSSA